jgi:hypothetical protein
MKTLNIFLLVCSILSVAFAQEPEKIYQEKLKELTKLEEELAVRPLIDHGGWFYFEICALEDKPFKDERIYRTYDARFWVNIAPQKFWRLYLRSYSYYVDFNKGHGYREDFIEKDLRLDVGFIDLDLTQHAFFGLKPLHFSFRLGRQFFQTGRGIVYQNIADGVQINYLTKNLTTKIWVARSIHTHYDIDQSRPRPDRSDRAFYSLETSFLGIKNHKIYGFLLFQNDHNKEDPEIAGQDFEYDSQYIGLGCRGSFFPRTLYISELTCQRGKSIATGTTSKEDIRAWAYTFYFEWSPWTPPEVARLCFEYMFGSGDKDRANPINTVGGNQAGTDDTSFVPFGYIMTGYALYPRLSNLHILKVGINSTVMKQQYLTESIQIGFNQYLYYKHKKSGISDVRASEFEERYIGTESDIYIRWRVFSDTSIWINYAMFFPGAAYPKRLGDYKREPKDFVSFSFIYSF